VAGIRGLELFRNHFAGFEDEYVLIGGAACHLWFESNGLAFRATKDLDVVLVAEALTPEFVQRFWSFVRAGRYRMAERSDRAHKYYRFNSPQEPGFPFMIELFARLPEGLDIDPEQAAVPIPMDEDISSLSAILLDSDYYGLIRERRQMVSEMPLAAIEVLIVLKMKAWLDLSQRRSAGERIDADQVAKHRSDVFRLALLLPGDTQWILPAVVASDLQSFLEAFPADAVDWGAIRDSMKTTVRLPPSAVELRQAITDFFSLSE